MKNIFLKALDKLLENLTSVKVWCLFLASWFFWRGMLDHWDWLMVAGTFLSGRILEYVINRRNGK